MKPLILLFLLTCAQTYSQWQPDARLTNNTAPSYTGFRGIAVNILPATDVHVVWADFRDGNYEVYYKRSTDKGATWGETSVSPIAPPGQGVLRCLYWIQLFTLCGTTSVTETQ